MLVCIENFFGDTLISGKKCAEKELREKFNTVIKLTNAEDFTRLFCCRFHFNELPYTEDVQVDFVIDLDTHLVYKPRF